MSKLRPREGGRRQGRGRAGALPSLLGRSLPSVTAVFVQSHRGIFFGFSYVSCFPSHLTVKWEDHWPLQARVSSLSPDCQLAEDEEHHLYLLPQTKTCVGNHAPIHR